MVNGLAPYCLLKDQWEVTLGTSFCLRPPVKNYVLKLGEHKSRRIGTENWSKELEAVVVELELTEKQRIWPSDCTCESLPLRQKKNCFPRCGLLPQILEVALKSWTPRLPLHFSIKETKTWNGLSKNTKWNNLYVALPCYTKNLMPIVNVPVLGWQIYNNLYFLSNIQKSYKKNLKNVVFLWPTCL